MSNWSLTLSLDSVHRKNRKVVAKALSHDLWNPGCLSLGQLLLVFYVWPKHNVLALIYRKSVQIQIHKYTSTQVTNTQIYKYKGVHWSSTFTLNPIISNMPNCAIPWIQILKLIYWTQSEEGGTGLDKQQEICHLLSFSQCHTCNVVHNDNDSTTTTTTPTT